MFLPFVLTLYYITPRRFRNLTLFIVDLVFYAWGEPWLVILMLFSILLNYTSGILIGINREKKGLARFIFILSVILNLGLLGFFKYAGFIGETLNMVMPFLNIPILEIALPIGISFYTFQTMSYTIDVYKNTVKVQKNIITFGTYVSLFPQLIAGPIVRYEDVAEQLMHRKETLQGFTDGVKLFLIGLSKKVLLANEMGNLWDAVRESGTQSGALGSWVGIIAYTFQIYFDFCGYSEMAMGLGKMFGFDFLKNFDYPYISKSITEFWRRWHISLGAFFREYVFYPVSTSKILLKWNTKVRKYLGNTIGTGFASCVPILCVWILTGLWHGAKWNYIGWGLFHGILICLSTLFEQPVAKLTEKLNIRTNCISWNIFRMLRTFLLCVIGRIIFMGKGIRASFQMITSCIVDYRKIYDLVNDFSISQREWGVIFIGVLILLCVSIAQEIREQIGIKEDIRDWLLRQNLWLRWTVLIAGILCVLIFGVYGTGSQIVFIYEQF